MTFNLSKVLLASACAFSLATLPLALSASAQTGTSGTTTAPGTTTTAPGNGTSGATTAPSSTNTGAMSNQDVDSTRGDRGFDWGWLGLLGLLGLAGLKRKPEQAQVYRDPNEVSRPGSRV